MIITDKQAMVLLIVLRDALKISQTCAGLHWTYSSETMDKLYNFIIEQQSDILEELK